MQGENLKLDACCLSFKLRIIIISGYWNFSWRRDRALNTYFIEKSCPWLKYFADIVFEVLKASVMPSVVKLILWRPTLSSYLTENKSFPSTKACHLKLCRRMTGVALQGDTKELTQFVPILVAARSKAWDCGRLLAVIVGSNPAGSWMFCLLWVLCVFR